MGSGIEQLILIILAALVLIIFVGSIYAFFYAIFLFIFSAGDTEKIQKAWNSIRYMILGIVFTIALLFIFPTILSKLGVKNREKYQAQNILNTSTQIVNYMFTFGKESISIYNQGPSIGVDNQNNGGGIELTPTINPKTGNYEL